MKLLQTKIYGNEALHKMLTRSMNSGHLCHAYLFYGKKGIGKKTLAMYLSAGVLCKGEKKPCFNCSSCHKLMAEGHPDFYFLDSKDAKNSIHIDVIREIRQDAYIMPNESIYKVYFIPNVENMSIGAFNALLKVLEEPPEAAMFILTASSKSAVPQTILSRCVSLAVYPLSLAECKEALAELVPEKSEGERKIAAEQSRGILGKALEILNRENNDEIQKICDAVLDGIIHINEYEILSSLVTIKNDRQIFAQVIDELLIVVRGGLLNKINGQTETNNPKTDSLSYKLSVRACEQLLELFQNVIIKLDSNVNLGILQNWLCAKIIEIIS